MRAEEFLAPPRARSANSSGFAKARKRRMDRFACGTSRACRVRTNRGRASDSPAELAALAEYARIAAALCLGRSALRPR